MKILVCGADGFLGSHVATTLAARGHVVVRGVRTVRLAGDLAIDYRADTTAETWLPRLVGVDAVINAVGILRERQSGDFALIHCDTPTALFEACQRASIRRVIQISALGSAPTLYLASKHAADEAMRRILPHGVALRPGLVFGANGASTRFFLALASLPLHTSPGGAGDVQPVHVSDLAEIVVRLLEGPQISGGILNLPGPTRLGYAQWLASYRAQLGFLPALTVPIPGMVMAASARLAGLLPNSMLSADTWTMLRAGNTGDSAPAQALLGRPLRTPDDFVSPQEAECLRLRALAQWRKPLLQAVLAFIWLASALLSAAIYPLEESLKLLAPFDLSGSPAQAALAAAVAVDLAMGLLTIFRPRRGLWLTQLGLVAVYSVLVAWRLPLFLIHPFGPILKNLAVVALLIQLWAEETGK